MKKRIALIPAYEPEMLLIELLERLKNAGFTSVVVDDGSKEGYQEIFKRAQETSTVLTHAENQGKGAALKNGLCIHKGAFSGRMYNRYAGCRWTAYRRGCRKSM